MVFSPQQVKFEFLSYIKEFGGDRSEWRVGACADPDAALFEDNAVDRKADIWLWKPTLSAAAAGIVLRYMTGQLGIPVTENSTPGPVIYLFKRTARTSA